MAPEGARADALQLIALRADAVRFGTSDAHSRARCNTIIAASGDDCGDLLNELLDLLGRVAFQLHSELGRLALWLSIAKTAEDDRGCVEQRQAARLVLSHGMFSLDDEDLQERGGREYDAACTVVNACDKAPETVVALVDLWLSLLPELTAAPANWLETITSESRGYV